MPSKEDLIKEIEKLKGELEERKKSLPAHSVRPQQLLIIEELEEKIEEKQKILDELLTKK